MSENEKPGKDRVRRCSAMTRNAAEAPRRVQ